MSMAGNRAAEDSQYWLRSRQLGMGFVSMVSLARIRMMAAHDGLGETAACVRSRARHHLMVAAGVLAMPPADQKSVTQSHIFWRVLDCCG